jgi:hypothetical protein
MAKEQPTRTGLAVGINKGFVRRLTSWRISASPVGGRSP